MYRNKKIVKIAETCARVTGYYRPVQAWNAGKQQEHRDRAVTSPSDLGA